MTLIPAILIYFKSVQTGGMSMPLFGPIDRVKILYLRKFCNNVKIIGGDLAVYKKSLFKLAPTSTLVVNAPFIVGFHKYSSVSESTIIELDEGSELIINGGFTVFRGSRIHVCLGARLQIDGGYCNNRTIIACAQSIKIGAGATIADGVCIMDSDFHSISTSPTMSAPITIGSHVWIGTGATILKGVTIGDGAVIGAGSVVTHDVPARALAVGNPARVIRENIEWQ